MIAVLLFRSQLFPHLGESADILLEEIAKEASTGKETSVCDLYKPLAMDYISGASFGIETSFQKDRNHPLFLMAKKVLPGIMTGPFHMIARRFPHSLSGIILRCSRHASQW